MNAPSLPALLLPLLLAAPAAAQDAPKPAAASTQEWVTVVRGKPLGGERATTTVKAGKRTLKTVGDLAGRKFTSTITVRESDMTFEQNRLEVLGAQIVAVRTPEGVSVKLEAGGQTREEKVKGKGPFLILENMVFSSYDLLTRYAKTQQQGKAFSFTLVVPSRMLGAKGEFVPKARFKTTFQGKPFEAQWARVTVASLDIDVAFDPTSGACYAVRIVSQQIEGHRKGFALPAIKKLPPPKLPEGAREVEVKVENQLPGSLAALPGTLTLPPGKGPFPVVVLVQGSGATDRDETIGPNKPFRDLAYGLAHRGVATLRYDKRNWRENHDHVIPPERWKTTVREESILDAIAALKLAKSRPELGARFLVGHSLGALAAPYVAKQVKGLAGIVLMAGPGRPMDVLLREQQTYQLGLLGRSPEEAKKIVDKALAPFDKIRSGELTGKQSVMGAPAYYWADMLERDAPAVLETLSLPVLVLQGDKDCQVAIKDYDALVAALKKRPETATYQAKRFPSLNHLFMKVEGRSTGAEYGIENRVDPAVIETLATWIKKTAHTQ